MTRLAFRAARLVAICAAIVAAWYAFSYNRDWFLFHLHRDEPRRDTVALQQRLVATGLPKAAAGHVRYDQDDLPLVALERAARAPSAPTVCLIAGVHGNEPAGVETLLGLATELGQPDSTWPDAHWLLVPLANPWGWSRDLRHNGDNRDLARQFVDGQAQEAAWLKPVLKGAGCNLLIDLHEDRFEPGFYLLAYDERSAPALSAAVAAIERATGVAHNTRAPGGVYRIGADELGGVVRTTAPLWARLNGVEHAFIVETHDQLPLAQRVAVHRAAIRELMRLLAR